MRQRAITLLSGGLDSAVATAMAGDDFDLVLAITLDYGQRAAAREVDAARRICRSRRIEHRVIETPWLKGLTRTALVDRSAQLPEAAPETVDMDAAAKARAVWVPNRNGVFISIAASFAESMACSAVVAGFNAEEAATFPDNSRAFVDASNAALGLSTLNGVKIASPTLGMRKDEIARLFVRLSLDPRDFWCCYEGGERLCGRCESCARTIRAFQKIDAWDTIRGRFA